MLVVFWSAQDFLLSIGCSHWARLIWRASNTLFSIPKITGAGRWQGQTHWAGMDDMRGWGRGNSGTTPAQLPVGTSTSHFFSQPCVLLSVPHPQVTGKTWMAQLWPQGTPKKAHPLADRALSAKPLVYMQLYQQNRATFGSSSSSTAFPLYAWGHNYGGKYTIKENKHMKQ